LIDFLKTHYASTTERLTALRKHQKITFELLHVFFQPGSIIYIDCATSEKPKCLKFDSGKMKTTDTDEKCFELNCRYLTHNGKRPGEAPIKTRILEFQGATKITSLGVYPLQYHPAKQEMIDELTERKRKFINLTKAGVHYRTYQGMAFYRKGKDKVQKFNVRDRVIVDPKSFRKKNPNYFFPSVRETSLPARAIDVTSLTDIFGSDNGSSGKKDMVTKRKTSFSTEDLLLCSPTVFGFSLSIKL
jgi:hypothetical protein